MVWNSKEEHIFNHSWEKVVEAAVRKYPNPISTNVVGSDVLERHVDENGRLCSKRIIETRWKNYYTDFVYKVSGLDLTSPIHAYERSVLDPKEKKFELISKNYNFLHYVIMDEKLVYTPHPDDNTKTKLEQSWSVKIQNIGFTSILEGALGSNIQSTASSGRKAIEFVINQIREEVERYTLPAINEVQNLAVSTLNEINQVQRRIEQAQKNLEVNIQNELKDFIISPEPSQRSSS